MKTIYLFIRSGLLTSCLLITACTTQPVHNPAIFIEQELGKQYPDIEFSNLLSTTRDKNTENISSASLSLQQSLHIMLTHSPKVRMQLAKLGIANAETLQAGIISNPHISIGAMKPEDGGRWQLETGISQPLLSLFTRPLRRQLTEEGLIKAQLVLQGELQESIAKTGKLYFSAIAAQQNLQIQQHMHQATLARQQLAQAMYKAGNMSENNFLYYDNELRRAELTLQKQKSHAYEKQLQLANFIGLPSTQTIRLPQQLTSLPQETFNHHQLLEQAKANRVDIKIAQQQLDLLQKRKQLIKKENGWRDMEIGINAEREFDGAINYGPELEFALPLFNRGQAKIAAIDAKITQAEAELQYYALKADTAIAQAINQLESAKNQLSIIQSALHTAEKRVQLSNREVNFMLSSPFELLAIKRQEIQLAQDYTEQLNSYWQARSQLELAIGQALVQRKNYVPIDHKNMDHSGMNHHSHTEHSLHQDSEKKNFQDSDSNSHQEHNHD